MELRSGTPLLLKKDDLTEDKLLVVARPVLWHVAIWLLLLGLPAISFARQSAPPPAGVPEDSSASISGVLLDASGSSVPNASVVLTRSGESGQRTSVSGPNGAFKFDGLVPGSYVITVEAAGFGPFRSSDITVTAQQAVALPPIQLMLAEKTSEVTVRTTEAIAAQQVKAEEKQRVLGIVPDFYTVFLPDAAPLTAKQKYSLTFRDTFDPVRFGSTAIVASIEQSHDTFPGYGRHAAGWWKRYAAAYGNGLSSDLLSHAIFPSLFHQDPRYFYQGTGTTKSRVLHAISFSVIGRSDSGRPMPNYSYLFGDLGSAAISNLYYPHANRGVGLVFTNFAIGIGARAGGSLVREFLLRRITNHVPAGSKP